MKKLLIDTSTSGVIGSVTPIFIGPAVTMNYVAVNGFQSFNNSSFSINASTGDITLSSPLAVGRYYLRYRATRADNILQYIEETMIVDVASEIAPTGSGDNTYSDGALANDILATVSSGFTSPTYELIPLVATSNPATIRQTYQALTVDASGNIRWTGDIAGDLGLNYKVRVVARNGGMSCFSGQTDVDITYSSPELAASSCIQTGLTFTTSTPSIVSAQQGFQTDGIAGDTIADSYAQSILAEPAFGGFVNRSARAFIDQKNASLGPDFEKGIVTSNIGNVNANFRVSVGGSLWTSAYKPKVYLAYSDQPLPAVTNPLYDTHNWNIIGYIDTSAKVDSGTSQYYVDCSGKFPNAGNKFFTILVEPQLTGDFSAWLAQGDFKKATVTIAGYFNCP